MVVTSRRAHHAPVGDRLIVPPKGSMPDAMDQGSWSRRRDQVGRGPPRRGRARPQGCSAICLAARTVSRYGAQPGHAEVGYVVAWPRERWMGCLLGAVRGGAKVVIRSSCSARPPRRQRRAPGSALRDGSMPSAADRWWLTSPSCDVLNSYTTNVQVCKAKLSVQGVDVRLGGMLDTLRWSRGRHAVGGDAETRAGRCGVDARIPQTSTVAAMYIKEAQLFGSQGTVEQINEATRSRQPPQQATEAKRRTWHRTPGRCRNATL